MQSLFFYKQGQNMQISTFLQCINEQISSCADDISQTCLFIIFAVGVGVFVVAYTLHKVSSFLTKVLLLVCLGFMIWAYYKHIDGYYYLVVLGIYTFFVLLALLSFSDFIKQMKIKCRTIKLPLPTLKKVSCKLPLFCTFSFVFVYAFGVNFKFYHITDNYFTYIAPLLGFLIFRVIDDLDEMQTIYEKLRGFVQATHDGKTFTLADIYQELDIKDRHNKFKEFIDEVVQCFESGGEIASLNNHGIKTYFYYEIKGEK